MEIFATVVSGTVVFVLGQIFQQYLLDPIQEFRRQRADTIYFAIRFMELVSHQVKWDEEDIFEVRKMRAALMQSMEMVPAFGLFSSVRIFGLPSPASVRKAADSIAAVSKLLVGPVRKGEPAALALGRQVLDAFGVQAYEIQ